MTVYNPPRKATVRGDWLPDDHPGYPAYVRGTWNGWAIPLFDRETAEKVVQDQAKLEVDDCTLVWDDDVIVGTVPLSMEDETFRIEPEYVKSLNETLYDMNLGWTWDTVEVLDVGPTAPQKAAFLLVAESLSCHSHDRMINEDGSHTFPIMAHTGRYSDHEGRRFPIHVTVGLFTIDRDGNVTVQNVKED